MLEMSLNEGPPTNGEVTPNPLSPNTGPVSCRLALLCLAYTIYPPQIVRVKAHTDRHATVNNALL